jgi:hypothetical protein
MPLTNWHDSIKAPPCCAAARPLSLTTHHAAVRTSLVSGLSARDFVSLRGQAQWERATLWRVFTNMETMKAMQNNCLKGLLQHKGQPAMCMQRGAAACGTARQPLLGCSLPASCHAAHTAFDSHGA